MVRQCFTRRRHEVAHLFFHSLSINPSLSFRSDNDSMHDFESWFVTVDEFHKILERLYKRNYVLVDVYEAMRGDFTLPEGKKPLILSFDDINYYQYMEGYGFATRMVLTSDGHIANVCKDAQGNEYISRNADSMAILETFLESHPDFSHHEARGIIGLTGYEGVLGYRNPKESAEQLLPLVAELKRRGWRFASHSWGHHHRAYSNEPIDIAKGRKDIDRWFEDVEPYIGKTDLFITPFGIDTRRNMKFDRYLRKKGFRYFFTVSTNNRIQTIGNAFYQPRIAIDGISFSKRPDLLYPFIGGLSDILSSYRKRIYNDAIKEN